MLTPKLPAIYFGGDYNPDQWPRDIWKEDMRLFKLAGVNVATLPVFSWAKLQPREDTYDFEWLDQAVNLLYGNGIYICLATSTAAQPAWMSRKYPEVLPVDIDGNQRGHGHRVNFCPSSPIYRKLSSQLAEKLAERYKDHPGLLLWHIGNEFGNNKHEHYCYCERCAAGFRVWLKEKYKTPEELNRCWYTGFWGHTVYDWEEIDPPSNRNGENICSHAPTIDYHRFMSDANLECYLGEYRAIKKHTPEVPVTTNLMYDFMHFDYFKWAEHMEVVSWDNYPTLKSHPGDIAFWHDLMRGLKKGQPFLLMEQAPSQVNWHPYNSQKRPGMMRLWSYQAVAHGSDAVMFFQLRQSRGALEKYHSGLIPHAGHENTRAFRECMQLGDELKRLGDKIVGTRIKAQAAIVFDWENWWATRYTTLPSRDLNYMEQVRSMYQAFYSQNIPVDLVKPEWDLSGYKLVAVPMLYMIRPGVAENLEAYTANGGTLVVGCFSGLADENDLVELGGYPGKLRKLLGIWIEEIDGLFPDMQNSMVIENEKINHPFSDSYGCKRMCDVLHLEGAEAIASFDSDYYKGKPALTVNRFGKGKAFYIATCPEQSFLRDLIGWQCNDLGIHSPLQVAEGVEVTEREMGGQSFLFLINHGEESVQISLEGIKYRNLLAEEDCENNLLLESKAVVILEKCKEG